MVDTHLHWHHHIQPHSARLKLKMMVREDFTATEKAPTSKSWIVKKCKKIFYHLFNSVKYLYLPSDTFRKHVERHVTYRKLAFKFTGYCRQSSYTDSAVVFTLLPAVAWDLKSQFPAGYMHFNICFKGVSGKIGIFHNEKLPIEVFWFFCLSRSWQWAGASHHCCQPFIVIQF